MTAERGSHAIEDLPVAPCFFADDCRCPGVGNVSWSAWPASSAWAVQSVRPGKLRRRDAASGRRAALLTSPAHLRTEQPVYGPGHVILPEVLRVCPDERAPQPGRPQFQPGARRGHPLGGDRGRPHLGFPPPKGHGIRRRQARNRLRLCGHVPAMGGPGHRLRFRMVLPVHQELGRRRRAQDAAGLAGSRGPGSAHYRLHDHPSRTLRAASAQLQLGDTHPSVREIRGRVVHQTRNPHRVRPLPAQGVDDQRPHRPRAESRLPRTQHALPGADHRPVVQRRGPAALSRVLRGGGGRLCFAEQSGRDQPGPVRSGAASPPQHLH